MLAVYITLGVIGYITIGLVAGTVSCAMTRRGNPDEDYYDPVEFWFVFVLWPFFPAYFVWLGWYSLVTWGLRKLTGIDEVKWGSGSVTSETSDRFPAR